MFRNKAAKPCTHPDGCKYPVYSKKLCNVHYWNSKKKAAAQKPKKPKVYKPIKPVSDKRAKLNKIYSILRLDFLFAHNICEAKIKCCGATATDVHHKKGRGKWFLVVKTWLAVCRACHNEIEANPAEAKRRGFSEDRLTDDIDDILFTIDELTYKGD